MGAGMSVAAKPKEKANGGRQVLELTSRSSDSFDEAIEQGIAKAGESVENIQSAWVKDQQVKVADVNVSEYQVTLKVTFLVN